MLHILGGEAMATSLIATYVEFARSAIGGVIVVALSLLACGAMVLWARRGADGERWPALLAATAMTVLVTIIYVIALAAGWWGGAYFQTPLLVQLALLIALSMTVWLAWLTGYAWLAERSGRALLIYGGLALLLILAVALADRAELTGGLIRVAEDGKTWIDALIGAGIMLAPLVLYEGIRRGLARDALP